MRVLVLANYPYQRSSTPGQRWGKGALLDVEYSLLYTDVEVFLSSQVRTLGSLLIPNRPNILICCVSVLDVHTPCDPASRTACSMNTATAASEFTTSVATRQQLPRSIPRKRTVSVRPIAVDT